MKKFCPKNGPATTAEHGGFEDHAFDPFGPVGRQGEGQGSPKPHTHDENFRFAFGGKAEASLKGVYPFFNACLSQGIR